MSVQKVTLSLDGEKKNLQILDSSSADDVQKLIQRSFCLPSDAELLVKNSQGIIGLDALGMDSLGCNGT